MEIILYKNNSEKNKIGKVLTDALTFSGELKNETSILNPIVLIETTNPTGYNYAYIPEFERYYFITDITSVNNGMWRISMNVDVLESFKTYLFNVSAIISNSENVGGDNYLSGDVWKTKVKEKTSIVNFPYGLAENGEFILITAGG